MQDTMSKTEIVYGIRRLNVVERLGIVTDIWDEIKESQELAQISEDDKRILLNRFANYRVNPNTATDWSELRQEVYDRHTAKS